MLHMFSVCHAQCLDGRKSVVPYAISVTGNLERGVLAYLYNSLQQVKKVDSKQRLQQRKVRRLSPFHISFRLVTSLITRGRTWASNILLLFFELMEMVRMCYTHWLLVALVGFEAPSYFVSSQSGLGHGKGSHCGTKTGRKLLRYTQSYSIELWV